MDSKSKRDMDERLVVPVDDPETVIRALLQVDPTAPEATEEWDKNPSVPTRPVG
jgi:hypothetical protein